MLQRDVIIQIEHVDRGGCFIGCLLFGEGRQNLAVELLKRGLAQTVSFSLSRTSHREILLKAETEAKEKRLNIWSVPGVIEEEIEEEETEQNINGVVVSWVDSFNCFYLQVRKRRQTEINLSPFCSFLLAVSFFCLRFF